MNRLPDIPPLLRLLAIFAAAALLAAGCAKAPPPEPMPAPVAPAVLVPLTIAEYPVFSDDMDFDGLARSIEQSLHYYGKIPGNREIGFGADTYRADHLKRSLEHFKVFLDSHPDVNRLNRFVRDHYAVYRSPGRPPDGDVLFTGYFEPVYPGSLKPDPAYRVPVYGLPTDLIKVDLSLFSDQLAGQRITGRVAGNQLVPYHTRREIIESGALSKKAPVIAWLKDPVDLYILQVQGSGKMRTPLGETVRLQYAGKNGRASRLVGRRLIEEGKISREDMSLQRIRDYFRAHPEDIPRLLNADPSYVFFRQGTGEPLGNIGVPLTPGRSIATDSRLFPPGALAYIETQMPLVRENEVIGDWSPLHRFVLNQDTGGAIRGTGRVDLFWGSGDYAETAAGHMKHSGRLLFLVLKPETKAP